LYPSPRAGLAAQGAEVYRANGCYVCHSQQVGHPGFGRDFERGWGRRRTVAVDYLWDSPVMLGDSRLGPDLANFGLRQTNTTPVLLHLYAPRAAAPGSAMPSYSYLFEKRPVASAPSADALPLSGEYSPGEGYEVVPRPAAVQLAAYLGSLKSDEWVFELPPPEEKKKATNSVAPVPVAGTNSPKP
jgi:cytochrome c oxidase cbb3-type subunit 2